MFGYTVFCVSVHQLMDILIVSALQLLWIILLWIFTCRFLCEHMHQFSLPFEYSFVYFGSSGSVLACSHSKLLAISSSFLVVLLFLGRTEHDFYKNRLGTSVHAWREKRRTSKVPWTVGGFKSQKRSFIFSYNVCNWEQFVWGQVSLPKSCSDKQSCSSIYCIGRRAVEILTLSW